MPPQTGSVIRTISLYSTECTELLRRAVDLEKNEIAQQQEGQWKNVRADPSFYSTVSDSEPESDYASPSSSDSDDNAQQQTSLSPLQETTEGADNTQQPSSNSLQKEKRSSKQKKKGMTSQQKSHVVQRHLDNLVCASLPISQEQVIHTSVALLPKNVGIPEPNNRDNTDLIPPARAMCLLSLALQSRPVVVLQLRSGRFAGGVFQGQKCLVHRAVQRYTVRKGQGKAQSAQDGSRRPKSMGSQLRRAGEESLRQDIRETLEAWKEHLAKAAIVLVSCPKTMKKDMFDGNSHYIDKDDPRIRKIPLDVGRPTFDSVCVAHEVLMTTFLRERVSQNEEANTIEHSETTAPTTGKDQDEGAVKKDEKEEEIIVPLTPLHQACANGDIVALKELLELEKLAEKKMINKLAGKDLMTPLHMAAAAAAVQPTSTLPQSSSPVDVDTVVTCVELLLLEGHANPCEVDARGRLAYFLASHDKVRDAFRMARATLGEDYCRWDEDAKVGPALTKEALVARSEKEAEKRRKKKARQKAKKQKEKAAVQAEERQRQQFEEQKQQEEEAKRVRDGLVAKSGANVCDFCQKAVKGRRRNEMFSRLDYKYCSSECVQKHKRELMAAAAMARFGN